MAGKQAKILQQHHVNDLLVFAAHSRHPLRNKAIVLLSVRAGLRAGEIANLTWAMVLGADGEVSSMIELHDRAAKMRSGRRISDPSGAADRTGGIARAFQRRWRDHPVRAW